LAVLLGVVFLGGCAMPNLEKYGDQAALIGRILYASMFLLFGYGKISAFSGTAGYMGSLGLPVPSLVTLIAIIVEIGGGVLMLVGYQTRLVAFGLAIYALVTGFIGHFQLADLNQFQHFMKNIAIVGGSLAFVAFGAGAYSLDAGKRER
jgi:putative oxidoreductase